MLAAGVDTVELSLYISWQSEQWFEVLAEAKRKAKGETEPSPILIDAPDGAAAFAVRPTGAEGHEWLIHNNEYSMSIGQWTTPKQRPSISLKVRSETLWRFGLDEAVGRAIRMIEGRGGRIEVVKVSRLDLCVDVLLRDSDWRRDIEQGIVTRARDINPHTQHRDLTGLSIGKNQIAARFYDKPIEIARKSKKIWMFDIWSIDAVPQQHRVIRVEFQLRREKLKELGIDTFESLDYILPLVWAYCTKQWLRVAETNSVHVTQQRLRNWWQVVQHGFPGAQGAEPLVPKRAISVDREVVARQALGCLAALVALGLREPLEDGRVSLVTSLQHALREAAAIAGWNDQELAERIRRKQAKIWRSSGSGP